MTGKLQNIYKMTSQSYWINMPLDLVDSFDYMKMLEFLTFHTEAFDALRKLDAIAARVRGFFPPDETQE